MARSRDYSLNPPKNLSELNLKSMVNYLSKTGTDKQKADFKKYCNEHHNIVKVYQFDTPNGTHKKGEEYTTYDLPKIRRYFAKGFFPALLEKKQPKKPAESIEDLINSL